MLTFLQLKNAVRSRVFPAGEARNLRPAHDKSMVDALVDIQRWVDCIQNNNIFIAPHCSTFFNCGLTSFDFPRGKIKRLSVVSTVAEGESESDSSDDFGPVTVLNGARWEMPVAGDSSCEDPADQVLQLTGEAGKFYNVKLRFRGVVEFRWYEGGQLFPNTGGAFREDPVFPDSGVYSDAGSNEYYLLITAPDGTETKYALNGSTVTNGPQRRVMGIIDYTVQISVEGTSTATLIARSIDNLAGQNPGLAIPEIDPDGTFPGQFIQMDVVSYSNVPAAGEVVSNSTIDASTRATDPNEWCEEIVYDQVEPCDIRRYLAASRQAGSCLDISEWFAIPRAFLGNKTVIPVPTDEGVSADLPPLQLGYHYPQESTDSEYGRAKSGVWAIENGRIYVAPWIQSTETVVVKWEGIKRDWVDDDIVDDDPGILRAIELFLRWEHARDWTENFAAADRYELDYRKALAELIYDCEQENMVRSCEPSHARGMNPPDTETLTPESPLPPDDDTDDDDDSGPVIYRNKLPYTKFITCEELWDGVAPMPTGPGRTGSVAIGEVSATSQAQAEIQAENLATQRANADLAGCTFYNKAQSYTATCGTQQTVVWPASDPACNATSQAQADACAMAKAVKQANDDSGCGLVANAPRYKTLSGIVGLCPPEVISPPDPDDIGPPIIPDPCFPRHPGCIQQVAIQVSAIANAGTHYADTLAKANKKAELACLAKAQEMLSTAIATAECNNSTTGLELVYYFPVL